MPRHGPLQSVGAAIGATLGAGNRKDLLTAALAAAVALLIYLPSGPDDRLAVAAPWTDFPSPAGDGPVAGGGPTARDGLISRLQRLQVRDILDALSEPGRIVGDVISVALPAESTAYRLAIASAVFGAATVAVLVVIMRRLDIARTAAVASALGFAFQQSVWSHAAIPDSWTGSLPLLALSVAMLVVWSEHRSTRLPWIGIGCWLLSVAAHPSLLWTAPAVAWFVHAARLREPRGVFLASTATGTALRVGVLLVVAVVGLTAGARDFDALRVRDLLSSEFGLLGSLFLSVGLIHYLWLQPTPQALLLSFALAGVAGWMSGAGAADARQFAAVLLLASPIVGHGMSVIARSRTERNHVATATAVLLAFPAVNAFSHADAVARARDESTRRLLYARALAAVLPDGGAVAVLPETREPLPRPWPLAESVRLRIVDLPWDVRRIRDLAASRPTFALEPTRSRLEFLGFRFDEPGPIRMATPLDGYLKRLPKRTIVAAVAGRDMTERAGSLLENAMRVIGGGRKRLLGPDFYGLVGFVRGAAIMEDADPLGVNLRMEAGEALDDSGRLLPVTLQIESTAGRTRIDIDGVPVLTNPAGAGIVVLRPDGAVRRAAVAFDHDDVLWTPVEPSTVTVARLAEWKPCMSVGTEGWVDVSRLLTGSGTGVLFPSRSAGVSLGLYLWKDDQRLLVRQAASSAPPAGFTIETFDRSVSADNAALDRLLELDGLASDHPLRRQPVVQRLEVDAQENEPRLTAMRFNATVVSGIARLLGPADAQRVTICGAG